MVPKALKSSPLKEERAVILGRGKEEEEVLGEENCYRKSHESELPRNPRLRAGGFQFRKPIPLKIRRVLGLLHVKSYIGAKRPPAGVVRKFGEESAV
ncbi:hypothetical protein AVEN_61885-1 [Araneus ventricosus]|uniref:Uncharacterized protein n=1 Tax=Araneus ventricosus TaxID=182803 RepID=A0A4Y2SU19_ARAVE|nr:hypothetical protein AVEN_61885-1 [Araneus ventricosus]